MRTRKYKTGTSDKRPIATLPLTSTVSNSIMAQFDPRPLSRIWSLECIGLILGHLLNVPERRFASLNLDVFDDRQLAATSTGGVSWDPWQLLLVSKLWRELGEPLLYYTVVVRSQAQAQTLSDTFREHPALAGHVRKLRLEGLYGLAGAHVVHCTAATVLDVWLEVSRYSVTSDSDDIAQALALSLLNPRRAILHDGHGYQGDGYVPAYVAEAIGTWSRLEYVQWTFGFSSKSKQERAITASLGTLQRLKVIEIPWHYSPSLEALKLAAVSPALRKVITYKHFTPEMVAWFSSNAPSVILEGADESLRLQSYYEDQRRLSFDEYFAQFYRNTERRNERENVPPTHQRHLPGEILDLVVVMALRHKPDPDEEYRYPMECLAWYNKKNSIALLQVSRQVREITLSYLVQRPFFGSISKMVSFINFMLTRRDLVHRVTALEFDNLTVGTWSRDSDSQGGKLEAKAVSSVYALNLCIASFRDVCIIKFCNTGSDRLFELSPSMLDALGTLLQLEELSGVTLGWNRDFRSSIITSQCLARFTALRILDNVLWYSPAVLSKHTPWSSVFSSLQTLELRHESEPKVIHEVWKALALMELPLLTSFGYPDIDLAQATPFFEKHGTKLERLVLNRCHHGEGTVTKSLEELCPNVTELEFGETLEPDAYHSARHSGVTRIIVNEHDPYNLLEWWNGWTKRRRDAASPAPFPALKEVHIRTFWRWNKGSYWIDLSDDMRAEGIFVYNSSGEAWRPRLRRQGPEPLVIPDPASESEEGMDVGAADVAHINKDVEEDDDVVDNDDDTDNGGDAGGESDVD
ncbi:hypothetical protein EXIGLDRAFT_783967 [Exidia glandulosa HHB12029]|uniref:Uncharacterized protein n=1 Tax=Exidia glandulosa HHB12029 TaxID=1314781 RepID=A0A165Z0K2_EXIGL|nr:hypothetical protein EXIGLDRAFT_783967 [Exidia glandulosa HHB12029]